MDIHMWNIFEICITLVLVFVLPLPPPPVLGIPIPISIRIHLVPPPLVFRENIRMNASSVGKMLKF